MAIHYRENQFPGINAHLHSYLQNEPAGWEEFHGMHISHLAETIDSLLPDGYLVRPEKSMQIREFHPDTGEPVVAKRKSRPKPDLTLLKTPETVRPGKPGTLTLTMPTRTLPASAAVEADPAIYLTAFSIRSLTGDDRMGTPVTWIELLSPTNKPGGTGAIQYREKRVAAVQAGLALVEIDYLHETPPVVSSLPSYVDNDDAASPYLIMITNPRPTLPEGELQLHEIAVDEPLPVIKIPLAGHDFVALDCTDVYNRTFRTLRAFSYIVDYEQEPVNFDRYHAADQDRIRARMSAVKVSYQREEDE